MKRVMMTAVLAMVLAASTAMAQQAAPPLADKLPDSSLVYLGWGGVAANQAALEKTGLGQIVNAPQTRPQIEAAIRQLETLIRKEAEGELPPGCYDALRSVLLDLVVARPWAVSLIDLKPPGPDNAAAIEVAFVADLGDNADAIMANVNTLIDKLVPDEVRKTIQDVKVKDVAARSLVIEEGAPAVVWLVSNKHLVVTVSTVATTAEKIVALLSGQGAALSANPQFAKVAAKTGGGLFNLYLDLARVRKELLPMGLGMALRDPDQIAEVNKILAALGVDAIDALGVTVGPAGGDFLTNIYALMPSGKPGLLVLANQKPLADALLATVPADATFALLVNINQVRLFDELEKQLAKFPEAKAEFDKSRADMEKATGLNVRTDLAEALGDGVAIYNSPDAGGFLISGLTIVREVRGYAKLQAALPKLEQAFLDLIRKADPGLADKLAFRKATFKNHEYHYLWTAGLPVPVAPAWCLTEKYFVLSMFPQTLQAALVKIEAGGADSLMANPRFAAARAAAPKGASAVGFVNNRQLVRIVYPVILPLWQVACSMAAGEGVKLDVNALPTQEELARLIGDDFGAVIPDPEGVLLTERGPTPLSGLVNGLVLNPMVAPAIALPALVKARQAARRVQSAANLKGLFICIMLYSQAHNEQWPDNLQQLVDENYASPEMLVSSLQKGPGPSYIYLKPRDLDEPNAARHIVAYERPENNDNEGTNVLFLDGHVQWCPMWRFEELLKETEKANAKAGEQPAVQPAPVPAPMPAPGPGGEAEDF